jgi:hypothetical protein
MVKEPSQIEPMSTVAPVSVAAVNEKRRKTLTVDEATRDYAQRWYQSPRIFTKNRPCRMTTRCGRATAAWLA